MWNFLRNIIDQWTDSDKIMGTVGAVMGYFAGLFFMDINTLAGSIFHWMLALVGAGFTGMAAVLGKHFGEKIINHKIFKNAKSKRANKRTA